MIYVLEQGWGFRYENVQSVKYDRIEMIAAQQPEVLLADPSRASFERVGSSTR